MSLNSLLDSDFVKNSQKFSLAPHKIPVLIYVEDTQDIEFWEKVFSFTQVSQDYEITIKVYREKDTVITGKDKLMQLTSGVGTNFMLCVDADFDVLLANSKYHTKLQSPYIIHTCYYAIENILSNPSRLKQLVEKGKPQATQVDYTEMLKCVSKAIWPAFTLLLCATSQYNEGEAKTYSQKDFNTTINPLNIQPNNYVERTSNFKLDSKAHNLIAANQTNIQAIENLLSTLFCNAEDTYKVMYGHSLFGIIAPFLRADMKNCSAKETGSPTRNEVEKTFYTCSDLKRDYIPNEVFTQIGEAFNYNKLLTIRN